MADNLPSTVDVLICGFGPVGATLANLLGRQGVRTLVIDKATEIFAAPRAIALDNEALRILQMAGLEDGAFATVPIPRVRMHSPLYGLFACAQTSGATDGHPNLVTFYQPELEQVLRSRLDVYPGVTIATGMELLDFSRDGDGVLARLRRASGGEPLMVRARFLVGADGAGSTVRHQLAIPFEGETFVQDWLVVDAKGVPTPIDDVEFLCNPRRPGPRMIAPGGRQRWEFMLKPGETRAEMEDPQMVRRLLRPWVGDTEIEIERTAVYRFHARIAQRFNEGPVFLVGDAAHITPPFAGQGLVAGLRDVANLAWKLAWVVKGRAAPSILDSYDQERRPHAKSIINLARLMGRLIMPQSHAVALLLHGTVLLIRQIPGLRRYIDKLEIKPPHHFKRGLFLTRPVPSPLTCGWLLPQGWLRPAGGGGVVAGDEALGQDMMLLGLGVDPASVLTPDQMHRWAAFGGKTAIVLARGGGTARPGVWEDVSGTLVPGRTDGWVVIVRPDRTIAAAGPLATAGALLEQVLGLCGASSMTPMATGSAQAAA